VSSTSKNYWLCQLIGWTSVVLIEVSNYTFFIAKKFIPELLLSFTLQAIAGLFIMHGYRWYLKINNYQWQTNSSIWIKAFLETVVLAGLQTGSTNLIYLGLYGQAYIKEIHLIDILGNIYNWMRYFGVWVIIYFMYQLLRKSNETEKAKILAENNSKSAELELLKSQLNPHFLFNALNSIKALILIDPEKSRDAIVELSELLRFTLQYSKERLIPLEKELAEVEKYLSLEQMRFGDRLEIQLDKPEFIAHCQIPPAILLTLAENAVKHGIGRLESGGKIIIQHYKKNNLLIIQMRNSGCFEQIETSGIGLKQIRVRLGALFGEAAQFDIRNESGMVISELSIPQT
jgi:sensor histidine kinase YesM